MKKFKLLLEPSSLTKQKLEMLCKFLDEIDNAESFILDPDFLTITFEEDNKGSLLAIAEKYGIVNLTEL